MFAFRGFEAVVLTAWGWTGWEAAGSMRACVSSMRWPKMALGAADAVEGVEDVGDDLREGYVALGRPDAGPAIDVVGDGDGDVAHLFSPFSWCLRRLCAG
jgi:hypothetical protein